MALPYEVRRTVCLVLDAYQNRATTGKQGVLEAMDDLTAKFDGPEFKRYRESFGKLMFMMPRDFPGVSPNNVYVKNFADTLNHMRVARIYANIGLIEDPKFQLELYGLTATLAVMDVHHDSVNSAFKKQA